MFAADNFSRGRKNSSLATLNRGPTITKNSTNTGYATLSQPHFACTSDEVKCVISHVNPALFTETWLRDSIIENHLHISGYHLTARNRTTGPHDGVGLYIKNNPRFKSLEYLQDPDFETMWTWLQPTRLPRGVSPFLAWGDFHARSRFARPTIPEEKWGTTRSLYNNKFCPAFFQLQFVNSYPLINVFHTRY